MSKDLPHYGSVVVCSEYFTQPFKIISLTQIIYKYSIFVFYVIDSGAAFTFMQCYEKRFVLSIYR